jgi:hypothetical protein
MSDSGRTIEASQIEPREAFRIEEAVNLDDLAARKRFLTVGVKGQDFELVLWPGTPGRAKEGSAVYTIEVENCRTAFETLKSRGLNFETPEILEFPWGYAARFQDPDGNLLQLREGRGALRR